MPGRHIAPRHKAPRSLTRSFGRLAAGAVGAVPTARTAAVVALVGAAGLAAGVGMVTADAGDSTEPASAELAGPPETVDEVPAPARDSVDAKGQVSRSSQRPALVTVQRATKNQAMTVSHQAVTGRVTESVEPTNPRDIALLMLADYGWTDQFSCLDQLYISESNWDPAATNPTSGAYGIPQSLPAEKMATAGADWRTNPATQIAWGLDYIHLNYGSPCSAWSFKEANNWY